MISFGDAVIIAFSYLLQANGNINMIPIGKIKEFHQLINSKNLFKSIVYCVKDPLYFYGTDSSGNVYVILNPSDFDNVKNAAKYILGCLPAETFLATYTPNALKVIDLVYVDGTFKQIQ